MSIHIDTSNIDNILLPWQTLLNEDYIGYRNHVIRMSTFCQLLKTCNAEDKLKIEIAACFHDIGLWTANTLDYLPPSLPPAHAYLEVHSLTAWSAEINQMILQHHKLTPVSNNAAPLVELFRQGDLVDFSLGVIRFGIPKHTIKQIQSEFPNAGFHRMLLKRSQQWLLKHPFNPAPMMKW